MRLTDWIIMHAEASMSSTVLRIAVPADLRFADLNLRREANGDLSFDTAPLRRIADASDPQVAELLVTADGISSVIVGWYRVARSRGEPADLVAEDIAAEIAAEDAAGQPFSLRPGRA